MIRAVSDKAWEKGSHAAAVAPDPSGNRMAQLLHLTLYYTAVELEDMNCPVSTGERGSPRKVKQTLVCPVGVESEERWKEVRMLCERFGVFLQNA